MTNVVTAVNPILDIAVAAHNAGLCVLPPKQDGSKRPMKAWEQYANTSSTLEEVQRWYSNTDRTGMGLVLGAASSGTECFEFDDMEAYDDFLDRLAVHSAAGYGLGRKIESGCSERSPNGVHWFYRCPDFVSGNTKLARRPKRDDEKLSEHDNVKVLIETRGQGGYAIVAPSHGDVHPSGKPYVALEGGFDTIATITAAEKDILWEVARSLDELSSTPVRKDGLGLSPRGEEESEWTADRAIANPPQTTPALHVEGERPGDWFIRTKDWSDVLEPAGWTHVFDRGVEGYWRRPGKDRDHSATVNYQDTDVMKVFSSSTPFDPDRSYTKFAAYAVLHHNGDYKAAARSVRREMPKESRLLGVVNPDRQGVGAPSEPGPSVPDSGSTEVPAVGSSWKNVDLSAVLSGDIDLVIPTMLEREDGEMLLYGGRIHEFKGAPEAGKGWFALLACKQELRKGNTVAYIDFEDYDTGIVERLLAMGIPRDAISERFLYFHPEEELGEKSAAQLFGILEARKPSLCIVDSVAEAMGINDLDPMSNTDAVTFVTMLPRRVANLGITVVLIDHVTKAADNTRYSVGAQHKLAAVSGSSFIVENEHPFGVGMKGSSRIVVAKDRPGRVRKNAEDGKVIGRMVVHSNDSGTLVDVQLVKPLSMTIEGMVVSKEIMGEVAKFIESQGRHSPLTRDIRAGVPGSSEAIDAALARLEALGYLMREVKRGQGRGFKYTLIKPYED